jgi:hypothetical protein
MTSFESNIDNGYESDGMEYKLWTKSNEFLKEMKIIKNTFGCECNQYGDNVCYSGVGNAIVLFRNCRVAIKYSHATDYMKGHGQDSYENFMLKQAILSKTEIELKKIASFSEDDIESILQKRCNVKGLYEEEWFKLMKYQWKVHYETEILNGGCNHV